MAKIRRKFVKMNFAPLPSISAAAPLPSISAAAEANQDALFSLLPQRITNIISEVINEGQKGIYLVKPRVGTIQIELNENFFANFTVPLAGNDFHVLTDAALVIVPSSLPMCLALRSYINGLVEDDVEERFDDFDLWLF